MTTDRYQRIDSAVRNALRTMPRAALTERELPTRASDQNLRGVLRSLRKAGRSFATIAFAIIELGGVPVTHETVRAWWRAIEKEERERAARKGATK